MTCAQGIDGVLQFLLRLFANVQGRLSGRNRILLGAENFATDAFRSSTPRDSRRASKRRRLQAWKEIVPS